MSYTGHGQLRHHFWGDYLATIGIKFASAAVAELAREQLPAFTVSTANPCVLVFHGGGAELKDAERQLRTAGADMKKVGSLKYSIDVGEPFTVTIRPPGTPVVVDAELVALPLDGGTE